MARTPPRNAQMGSRASDYILITMADSILVSVLRQAFEGEPGFDFRVIQGPGGQEPQAVSVFKDGKCFQHILLGALNKPNTARVLLEPKLEEMRQVAPPEWEMVLGCAYQDGKIMVWKHVRNAIGDVPVKPMEIRGVRIYNLQDSFEKGLFLGICFLIKGHVTKQQSVN
ncbi:uncharacterized protein BO66DRAFT_463907 [Aspergillus aculeatinus CBS 121060]|uniref:Uncharacterized protein n=1 Tax=Aspergillus aculeatinus CBS 121060 TaxID=1448322 RepID=A0ACD1GTA6_9EURO|nr:hypothetical protein BO66DRAFT_463907 [Aspergillus aculeatinus CBS 121060]RAH64565.1 hypothetical protein BO66DRAFT_463907 [Aspergillus aculeatinus CBS 121060]